MNKYFLSSIVIVSAITLSSCGNSKHSAMPKSTTTEVAQVTTTTEAPFVSATYLNSLVTFIESPANSFGDILNGSSIKIEISLLDKTWAGYQYKLNTVTIEGYAQFQAGQWYDMPNGTGHFGCPVNMPLAVCEGNWWDTSVEYSN